MWTFSLAFALGLLPGKVGRKVELDCIGCCLHGLRNEIALFIVGGALGLGLRFRFRFRLGLGLGLRTWHCSWIIDYPIFEPTSWTIAVKNLPIWKFCLDKSFRKRGEFGSNDFGAI